MSLESGAKFVKLKSMAAARISTWSFQRLNIEILWLMYLLSRLGGEIRHRKEKCTINAIWRESPYFHGSENNRRVWLSAS